MNLLRRFPLAVLAVSALAFTVSMASNRRPRRRPKKPSAPTTPSTSSASRCATASGCLPRSMCQGHSPGPYPFLMDRTPYSVGPYGEDQYPHQLGPSEEFRKAATSSCTRMCGDGG